MGDTQTNPKSWVGAKDCRGTGTWIRGKKRSWTREERKRGLQRVGDTELKPKSRDGAKDCRGTGTWTRGKKEAGLGRERKAGLKRVGDTQLKIQVLGWGRGLPRDRNVDWGKKGNWTREETQS